MPKHQGRLVPDFRTGLRRGRAMPGLSSYSRLGGTFLAVSGVLPATLSVCMSLRWGGPREALRQITFVHIRWRLWGFEQEFSVFCLLSLGVSDGGDNRVMYECKVNKAVCGCDDMFLLSVMYSSSECSRVMHLICCAIGSFRST